MTIKALGRALGVRAELSWAINALAMHFQPAWLEGKPYRNLPCKI